MNAENNNTRILQNIIVCVCARARYPGMQVYQRVCEDDVEDGVGATALLVHVGGRDRPRLVPLRHQRLNVLSTQISSSPPESSSSLPTHCYFQTTFKTEKSKNGAMYLCKRICVNVCVCNCVYMCVCIFMCMYMCVLWMESVFMCVCIFVYYGWKVKNQKRHLQKDLSNKFIGGIRFCAIIKNFSVSDDV